MAQLLALARLLVRLLRAELRSAKSVGFNNFFFCVLFLLAGSNTPRQVRAAFWSTLIFQLVLLIPLLVTFSVDTFNRLPAARMLLLPLSRSRRLLLSAVSLLLNPLFVLMLGLYSVWAGLATAVALLLIAFAIHAAVAVARRLRWSTPAAFGTVRRWLPGGLVGLAFAHLLELAGTLDLWAALLVALAGSAYRLLSAAPQSDAFPILALMVAAALSTIGQRMLSLDRGRAAVRYRLLPIGGWRLLLVLDLVYLGVAAMLTAPLQMAAGLAFSLMSLTAGRYAALTQQAPQRRGRFIGGDPGTGVLQILAGGLAGLGTARIGLPFLLGALVVYAGSVVWGARAWTKVPLNVSG